MKKNVFQAKKVLVTLFAMLLPLLVSAHDFEVNGIYYNIISETDKMAEVTYEYNVGYSGSITIPATVTNNGVAYSVTSIGENAFSGCSSLTGIILPERVASIGYRAFYCCRNLTFITIPENSLLTSIGDEAFYFCSSLTEITLPKGLTKIESWAFQGCYIKTVINFSGLNIKRGEITYGYVGYDADRVINTDYIVDGYAFKTIDGVHYLTGYIGDDTELTLPTNCQDENYQIGKDAFRNCSTIASITIPESVTGIGNYAFENCNSLTSITLPDGVTSIGNYAFRNCCSLKELTLGKGLKSIASGAFPTCTDLEKITIHATQPPRIEGTGNALFSNTTYENAVLYVPQGCAAKYQVMTGWSGFYNISEIEDGTPDYLTLRQADNGAIGIAVDLGRTYKVCITPSTGWKIHSVTFNGTDITAQLKDDNTLTTPTINESSELVVAYEKDNTAIRNAQASHIKVQGHQGTLRIIGTSEGDAISVYTTDGILVTRETAEASETDLTLSTGQVYIVTIGDKVVKIGL